MTITMSDYFCGGGGTSHGAERVEDLRVTMAANHWPLAVQTHQANLPDADHDCADLSQVEPHRHKRTNIGWFSPSCTAHSGARQVKFETKEQADAAERARVTMWDVVRFSEVHHYDVVLVENVVEVAQWAAFQAWLLAMTLTGYVYSIMSINSAHVNQLGDPAPQLRDRLYIMFWKAGTTRPDVEKYIRPRAVCTTHGEVTGVQTWKTPGQVVGKYKRQYLYTCPACAEQVEPIIRPAASIVDWSDLGQRIGDRDKPLAEKTMARIAGGRERWRSEHLLVPVEGRTGLNARPASMALRTQTARRETAIAFNPFIAELRGGGSGSRPVTQPMATVTASGNHHALVVPPGFVMRNNGSTGDGREHCTAFEEPLRTLTTKGHQSIVTAASLDEPAAIADWRLRMLQPQEVKEGTGFDRDYILLGSKRDQVRMSGNAVTPNVSQALCTAVVETLNAPVRSTRSTRRRRTPVAA